ncbi:hypothetical protein Hdeb2414_s0001g00036271 [Helianthus debilis subsp. tardiflorus]
MLGSFFFRRVMFRFKFCNTDPDSSVRVSLELSQNRSKLVKLQFLVWVRVKVGQPSQPIQLWFNSFTSQRSQLGQPVNSVNKSTREFGILQRHVHSLLYI